MEYICRIKCFHNGRLFQEGERAHFQGKEKVPEHFAPLKEEEKKEKGKGKRKGK